MEGPAFLRFRLQPAPSTTVKKIRAASEKIHGCLKLAEEDKVRIIQDRGVVWLEVPKAPEDRSTVSAEHLWKEWDARAETTDGFAVPLGLDIAGDPIGVDFASANSPHLLIAGTTGSGKSVALNTLLRGAMRCLPPDKLRLHLIDPKGNELIDFEDEEHVDGEVLNDPEDAIALLEKAVTEMQFRYKRFKNLKSETGKAAKDVADYNERASSAFPRWLVVLDEYADLVSNPDKKKTIEGLLQRLCQKARAAGIHVIIATQKPLADVIGSIVKSNLPAALALKVKSSSDSRVVLDELGAETLTGMGDALLKTGSGKLVRLQCGYFPS